MGYPGARRPRDDMAGPDLERLALGPLFEDGERRGPELERRLALEEDEELLVCGVTVRRRAVVSGFESAVVHAGVLRAGLPREHNPASGLAFVGGVRIGEIDRARRLACAGVKRRRFRRR